ncbi:MAG: EamA family transporter [Bacteroidales bacterium]|nr:EamA family transporter [Bacteroidales bacterium]
MWLVLAFISASLLGIYDIFKKTALKNNAVIPVLFLNTMFCSLLFLPLIIASRVAPDTLQQTIFYIPQAPLEQHLFVMLKAVIVLTSWILAYFAIKHLPITIASPIKASQPVLTLLGATLIFGEQLNLYQWTGVILAITSFLMLSWSGKSEGINFSHNKWIMFIVLATIAGATSGLYDKYLMSNGFDRMTVQVWYTYYQMALMAMVMIFMWYPKRKTTTPFRWTPAILMVSLFLVAADFIYFYALSYPDSMISVVSMTRRSGVVVAFIGGALFFKEKNIRKKSLDLALVLLGMYFLYLGSE